MVWIVLLLMSANDVDVQYIRYTYTLIIFLKIGQQQTGGRRTRESKSFIAAKQWTENECKATGETKTTFWWGTSLCGSACQTVCCEWVFFSSWQRCGGACDCERPMLCRDIEISNLLSFYSMRNIQMNKIAFIAIMCRIEKRENKKDAKASLCATPILKALCAVYK